ncbi:DUF5682 family protein, partial [Streptosporangium saharense]|uniref:DUF5682 family protein n=1 Tax=Streptosporangium saharense TaxID=1706840 RepID=UPI0033219AB4
MTPEDEMAVDGPRRAVDTLAACARPYLLGVRHHSPALAAVVPALLDEAGAEVVCVELPADFQPWLVHLADPATVAPVALAGTGEDGRLGFYPFADFSPELAAVRWAREHGAEVLCCDLPLSTPAMTLSSRTQAGRAGVMERRDAEEPAVALPAGNAFAEGLAVSCTGRQGDDMWDRAVEVLAPGCPPEAVRRAALGVGWALRHDAESGGGVPSSDLAREAHMREVISGALARGARVAAVVGAFHAPALLLAEETAEETGEETTEEPTARDPAPGTVPEATSLVPYAFDLLDSRSGYPAGIRDPRWQQEVFTAGGDPERVRDAAARAITGVCRRLREAGHTAGTGEAVETLRVACDLARLRGLPAPGRGEIVEAVTMVLGQGEPLGRGRALARALEAVLVGTERGRTAPGTPRSGLGPAVEAELAALRLPCPDNPEAREVRLDPLRSDLDGRREILLQRLLVCGVGYGKQIEVTGTGDASALTTRWRLAWTPSVAALLDLAGIRGVTAELAAAGTLRETFRRESAEGGPTCELILTGLRAAAVCDLPGLVTDRLADAADVLPATAGLPDLLRALDLLEALRRRHLPGTTPRSREQAAELAATLLDAAVRALPGLVGSDRHEDAAALVALVTRAGEHRLSMRMDDVLAALAREGSPLMQGAALAARVLLDLDEPDTLGTRAAGWIDAATGPEGRHRLSRLVTGLLTATGPLLQSATPVFEPLLDRVDGLTDRDFLDRLPALRGGFDTLTPADRDRLLLAVTDRLGDRLDLSLGAPPELLALWTAADAEGLAALGALGIPLPAPDRNLEGGEPPATRAPVAPARTAQRLAPADRWRLLLGRETGRLPEEARRYAHALDELYGGGRGEGADDLAAGQGGQGGGQGASFPAAHSRAPGK